MVDHSNLLVYECKGALSEISKSLEHNLKQGKTPISSKLKRLNEYIKRGISIYQPDKTKIVGYTSIIKRVFKTLDSKSGSLKKRLSQLSILKNQFANTDAPIKTHLNTIMQSFEPGLLKGAMIWKYRQIILIWKDGLRNLQSMRGEFMVINMLE
jgi:hypothetical protein